jgi:Ohr subfamily peroxiredoxin
VRYGRSIFHKSLSSGGRNGSIRSEGGLLDLKLPLPRALGGRGDATNPEQLFGGYAACFENALQVSRDAGHRFADDDIDVVARTDLSRNGEGFVVAAALAVTIAGIDQQTAERLVQGAHATCRIRMRSVAMLMSSSPSRSGEPDRSI